MSGHQENSSPELFFLPLGGANEIGLNLYLYGYGEPETRQWLIVDFGITFPSEIEPGVDIILPDICFLEEEKKNITGILLTHAHEDHFGAIIDLWPRLEVPIYATPFTSGLLKAKLHEYAMETDVDINELDLSSKLSLGPFDIEFVGMSHSIPEANGLVIRTKSGVIFHTGDWKLDDHPGVGKRFDEKRLKELGDEGIDVLVCDSTNVLDEGHSRSESLVSETLKDIFEKAPNRVAVTTFASNVARIKAVAEAAKACGRHVVVVGRALHRVIGVAKETGYLSESLEFLSDDDFGYFPRDKVVALCTGSQGEMRAAVARIADEAHPQVSLSKGDWIVFSSKAIPGNEVAVSRVHNGLARQGIKIITDKEELVHVSGHPRQDELKKLYEWLKPKSLIPMHGEERHLQEHKVFAERSGIKETFVVRNGDVVKLRPGAIELVDEAPTGRLYRDGDLIITKEDPSIRERRKLSYTGIAVVSIVLNTQGELVSDPDVVLVGIPLEDENGFLLEDVVLDEITGIIHSIPRPRRKDPALVQEAVRRGTRASINKAWGKKTICEVMVSVV